jgi:hypothetical protein
MSMLLISVLSPMAALAQSELPASAISLFVLTNADRAAAGLPALSLDSVTQPIADQRAQQEMDAIALGHYDPDWTLILVRMLSDAHVSYALAGENLARYGSLDIGRSRSTLPAAHRANILEPRSSQVARWLVMLGDVLAEIFVSRQEPPTCPTACRVLGAQRAVYGLARWNSSVFTRYRGDRGAISAVGTDNPNAGPASALKEADQSDPQAQILDEGRRRGKQAVQGDELALQQRADGAVAAGAANALDAGPG